MRTANATDMRDRWSWEDVSWATHCGNCIANCSYRRYVRAGEVVCEEPGGTLPSLDGVPDMNPLGCQKGAAWSVHVAGADRVAHPLRRVGERGEGRFERISWDDALTQVADAVIDAVEQGGPEAVLVESGAEGGVLTGMGWARLATALGAASLDANATVGDVHLGHFLTFGNLLGGSSADDTFRSEVVIVWNGNPAFTRIPYFHYLAEARYRGAEVVLIAPDYSPSAMHADLFVPVVPGSDAALALAACHVVVEEDLLDTSFVCSQTDLPLLVRRSNGRFLREADVVPGGRAWRLYAWSGDGPVLVDPLRLDDPHASPAVELDAVHDVVLADGSTEEVASVFHLLRSRLADYSPEEASKACGVHPDTIRRLARMVATKRTKLYNGLGSCKHYHGDLMERSMDLLLALTGNWGSPGRGLDTYIIALLEGEVIATLKGTRGVVGAAEASETMQSLLSMLESSDPPMTRGRATIELMKFAAPGGRSIPVAPFLYYHGGFEELWNRPDYGDSPRPFSEHIAEAMDKGWWDGLVRPSAGERLRVLIQAGTNVLRRTRGGQRELLRELWPSLDLVVVADWRMNTVGLHADLILPVAAEGERLDLHAANSHSFERMLSEKAFPPAGEARSEWQMTQDIARAIARRAAERGLEKFVDGRGVAHEYAALADSMSYGRAIASDEDALDELLRDSALAENLPEGTTLAKLRETGWVRPRSLPPALAAVSGPELPADGPYVAYRHHVEGERVAFETFTGRAQFYIDHPWFLEADEQLPRHRAPPKAGGDHPLVLTGGHPRWSIHATNTTSRLMLETTRGHPVVQLSPEDAVARGISDDDQVRVFNDLGELAVAAKISASVRPGQAVLYASWEPYLFRGWRDATFVEPGMVKWLHLAAGEGHLGYAEQHWQPQQSDRPYRIDVERIGP